MPSLLFPLYPIKTPVPKWDPRWNACLKAKWNDRGNRPSQKKGGKKKSSLLEPSNVQEVLLSLSFMFAATSTRETFN